MTIPYITYPLNFIYPKLPLKSRISLSRTLITKTNKRTPYKIDFPIVLKKIVLLKFESLRPGLYSLGSLFDWSYVYY